MSLTVNRELRISCTNYNGKESGKKRIRIHTYVYLNHFAGTQNKCDIVN